LRAIGHSHLNQPQMQGRYSFDEGGASATGGWQRVPNRMASQRGEASQPLEPGHAARFGHWPLMRECFVFEDGQRLVLFSGLPDRWLEQPEEIIIDGLQTYFGVSSLTYKGSPQGGALRFSGASSPPGFILGWPKGRQATLTGDGKSIESVCEWRLPPSKGGARGFA
jgi:hypothetical protein